MPSSHQAGPSTITKTGVLPLGSTNTLASTLKNGRDALVEDPEAAEGWVVAALAAAAIFVLFMAARLCLLYMRKFPVKKSDDEHEAQPISELINRSGISAGGGGKRGGRYSVA
ncbi:unnamed protein product, partial [Mesorhabditis belari]|uniref:Uncharacterized protein n=1 Tax=Mesorhabditis belari TaxID=2138241 RepID=A0AAF3E985_9BILA